MTFKIPCRKVSLCDNYERLCVYTKKGLLELLEFFSGLNYLYFKVNEKTTHTCVYYVYEILSNLQHKLFVTTYIINLCYAEHWSICYYGFAKKYYIYPEIRVDQKCMDKI